MRPITPIIKKEIEKRSRSFTFPFFLAAFNAVLFVVSLIGSFGMVSAMRESHEAMYGMLLRVYGLTAVCEYTILLIAAPLFTAPSISGERETGTFDLLMTTYLTPADIVAEKMASAFCSMLTAVMSGMPALIVPLMFGGVNISGVIVLMLSFLPGIFFVLSISIFASAISSSVTKSIAFSYAACFLAAVGTLIIAFFTEVLSSGGGNPFRYLLVLNPLLPLGSVVSGQIGINGLMPELLYYFGMDKDEAMISYMPVISFAAQIAFSMGLIIFSIINITPARTGKRRIMLVVLRDIPRSK